MWIDRLTGDQINELPDQIESSRYIAVSSYTHNQHTHINSGELLIDDGTGRLTQNQVLKEFYNPKLDPDAEVETDLISSALREFQDAIDSGRQPAFLLPEKLFEWLKLQPLDETIQEVLDKGHLHEIARSPNMELIYIENLLPISRVKKFPQSAVRHLAAHSSCWQKRTFTSVVPKSLLALESKDEFNIYENKVYARLIDHLERYLQRRCREVEKIEEVIKKSGNFSPDKKLYWPMSRGILELWKEGYGLSADAEGGKGTLLQLKKMLKDIRGLKQTGLYKSIPLKDDVGIKIRLTNVLSHDQHYRHVAHLWYMWQDNSKDIKIEPKNALRLNRLLANAYVNYVRLLIERALVDLGFLSEKDNEYVSLNGSKVSVQYKNHNIVLGFGVNTITFIPMYSPLKDKLQFKDAIIVSPESNDYEYEKNVQCASSLYFYSLECLVNRISIWLLKFRLMDFIADKIEKVPSEVSNLITKKYGDLFHLQGTSAYLKKPSTQAVSNIFESFKKSANTDVSIKTFLANLDDHSRHLNQLLYCPLCQEFTDERDFMVRDNRAFMINGKCGHIWKIDLDENGRMSFLSHPNDGENIYSLDNKTRLMKYGRFSQEIYLG